MKIKNIIFYLGLPLSLFVLLFGCQKPEVPETAEGKGSTIVRMPSNSGFKVSAIDLVATSQTLGLVDVYREVSSQEALNSSTKVTITEDPAVVTAYNTAKGTSYIVLPPDAFAIDPANPKVGDDYTLTFHPGEFYKQLKIAVPDATVLDPNKKYALGFRIAAVDKEGKISASQQEVVVEVGIKNKWDGVYRVTGTMVDGAVSTLTGNYPLTWELRTTGSNTLAVYDKSFGTQTHLIYSGGALSQYGSFGLNFEMDPATHKIIRMVNAFGQPSANGRSAALDPTGVNAYDPETKTFRVKYFLLQPGTTVRTTFDETWVYTGVR